LFAGFTHKPAILLAEKLISIAPKNLTKVFFSDNGSTAVEVAVKMSFQYWQNTSRTEKTRFIALDRGYHGDTIGAMSVSGESIFNEKFSPMFFPSFKIPSPYCYRCPMDKDRATCGIKCIKPLEKLLKEKSDQIAGVILEPLVLCAGGMIVYPREYLAMAGRLAKKHNVHLILDEVATGFGRTGKMFACEYIEDIRPDFLCLSKGLTGGYLALGATLTTNEIYRAFYADYKQKKTFFHGHTFTANPLACAAALASLEIFEKERTLERIKKIIPLFRDGLERFRTLSIVGDVRHIGMIGALELVKNKKAKQGFDFEQRIGFEIYRRALKRNLVLRPLGNITYFFLPLCIKKKELQDVLGRAYSLISSFPKTTIHLDNDRVYSCLTL
jgi:adenosylmethionine-8-amino-7-oxononanoate aminotransferase